MIDLLGSIGQKKENGSESAKFAKLMKKGKVGLSLRLLQENNKGGILPLTHTTKTALTEKHLPAKVAVPDTKIEGPQLDGHEGIFEEINGLMIWKMVLKNSRCCRTIWAKCRLCKDLAEQKNLWRGNCGPQEGITKSCKKDSHKKM